MSKALLIALLVAASPAWSQTLVCPKWSPTPLGEPRTRLSEVRVLAWPIAKPLPPDSAPPLFAPFEERTIRGRLHQYWNMNVSADHDDRVECDYGGPERVLRLDANEVRRCELVAKNKATRFEIERFQCK